jgi:hypothetical protein
MTVSLEARRSEAESKLTAAKRKLGEAVLDGKVPDHGEIDGLENLIEAIDEATGVVTSR